MMKGLICDVYRPAKTGDCTGGGLSAVFDEVTVTGDMLTGHCPFEPQADRPELRLVLRPLGEEGYWTAYLVDADTGNIMVGMFGGNFVKTCDSRFPSDYPIPIHDRFELQAHGMTSSEAMQRAGVA